MKDVNWPSNSKGLRSSIFPGSLWRSLKYLLHYRPTSRLKYRGNNWILLILLGIELRSWTRFIGIVRYQWRLVAHLIGWVHQYFNKLINPQKILIDHHHHHQSVLPKGRSFIGNSGTNAAVLLKGRSPTANSGTKVAVLQQWRILRYTAYTGGILNFGGHWWIVFFRKRTY